MAIETFWYERQFVKYIVQFMEIFHGLCVTSGADENGAPKLINVPIQYGSKDRVAASILAKNTQNVPIRSPSISAYLNGITIDSSLYKGNNTERALQYVPRGGIFPEDIKTVRQLMPVPYRVDMKLTIFATNTQQHFQILEQILVLFDPQLQIQTTDAPFDWTRMTSVTLQDIGLQEQYPTGNDRRLITTELSFSMPVYLSVPAKIRADYINSIRLRIGAVNFDNDTDILTALDDLGVEYEEIINGTDLIKSTGLQ